MPVRPKIRLETSLAIGIPFMNIKVNIMFTDRVIGCRTGRNIFLTPFSSTYLLTSPIIP